MKDKLNKASQLKKIQDNYFVRMMLPDAEERAELYVKEEKEALLKLMTSIPGIDKMNFVIIGSGTIWYIELAYDKTKTYVAVEPLANIFIQRQFNYILSKHKNIKIIDKEFGDFTAIEIPNNNSIFVFHFNILAYIPNPIRNINKYLKEGDILYISSWNNSDEAKQVRKTYFDYLNLNTDSNSFKINPEETVGLCNLDIFPFHKLKYYKRHERIKGKITDILIIYC